MNKLKFKTFTWPSNPAVFREQWERNPQYTRDDTGNDVFIGMSLAGCTITGEGSFQGAAAYSDFLTLRALFLDGSPGTLSHPVWGDIYCYFTGLGMTGPIESVLGIRPEQSVEFFLGGLPGRYQTAPGPCRMQGAIFTLDSSTGLCTDVERIEVL